MGVWLLCMCSRVLLWALRSLRLCLLVRCRFHAHSKGRVPDQMRYPHRGIEGHVHQDGSAVPIRRGREFMLQQACISTSIVFFRLHLEERSACDAAMGGEGTKLPRQLGRNLRWDNV